MNITKLKGVIPDEVYNELINIKQIDGPLRLSHFLSQCSHESSGFKLVYENLNYSANGLMTTFKLSKEKAILYQRKPQLIANYVYRNKNGNGDELSGDGWKFKGRGYIQLTTRNNYVEFDKTVDDDILANPDLVATKYPLQSAAFFFTKNNLWSICNEGTSIETIKKLTKRINGGYNGLENRILRFNQIYKLVTEKGR